MPRNIPAMILGSMAGVAVSMSSGFLLASYVVAGIAPAYVAPPRLAKADREVPAFIDDNWPTPSYVAQTN